MWLAWLVIAGSIDGKAVKYALEKAQPKIHSCYAPELAKNKNLAGTVKAKWQIDEDGHTSDASVVESSMKNANVETCLLNVIGRLKFAKPKGGPVVITYPFNFEP